MTKVVITQSNYIPWIGYFDLINSVDEFVLFDDVQFTKRDWRNRNYINLNNKKYLLSIPVITKGRFNQKINEVKFFSQNFKENHLKLIKNAYFKSKYFDEIYPILINAYNKDDNNLLSNFNINLIKVFSKYLKLNTNFFKSSDFKINSSSNKKLVEICKVINAEIYLSGKKALNYLDESAFNQAKIKLKIVDYKNQKNYSNPKKNFIEKLSLIDLMFNQGSNSLNYLQDLNLLSYHEAINN